MHNRRVSAGTAAGFFMGFFSLLGVLSPAHIGLTKILTGARFVGADSEGNKYYRSRPRKGYRHDRRYVIYKGRPDASKVPPEWHGWLHHQTDTVPGSGPSFRRLWQKPHVPNLTGTTGAYRPPGHILAGGRRPETTGDYEAWVPPGTAE
jgi:NADH:ubiquinone oxidoreductase subunit